MIETASDLTEQLRVFREMHPWRHIKCTGIDWYYLEGGFGTVPVILLPGCCSAEDMFTVMTALEDYKVVAIGCPEEVAHVPDIVQAIAAIMDANGIFDAFILGHSLGGMLAECFMRTYPERTAAMILANVAHLTPARETVLRGILSLAPLMPRPFFNRKASALLGKLLMDSPDAGFWVPFLEFEILELTREGLSNRVNCIAGALERCPVKRFELDGWNRKVLLIESDNDPAFTLPEREAIQSLYEHSEVHVIRNAGHYSPYTHLEEFATTVRHFLQSYSM